MNNKMKKKAILYTLSLSAVTLVSLSLIAFNSQRYNHLDASNTYALTLDKSNRISVDIVYKDLVFQTDSKSGNVCFRYTDVEALDGYHAYLNSSSKIINKDRMTSISNVLASFEGSLTLKT